MIKALLFAMPVMFALSTVAQADVSSCNLGAEFFKDKISEACQKSLESKMTDPQDKIYAQRIFKDWQPLKGYTLSTEAGFFQAYNKDDGDFFQAQWLSYEPAILVVNDHLVIDESKEPSTFRMIEKLFEKANAEKTASLSPLQKFFATNEAYAAARDRVHDAFFLYTVDGKTATAEQLIANDKKSEGDGAFGDGSLKKAKIFPTASTWRPNFLTRNQKFTCDATGRRLTKTNIEIDGKEVTITPIGSSKNQFLVSGYPEGKTLRVTMEGKFSVPPTKRAVGLRDKRGRPLLGRNGKPKYGYVFATPCSGGYSEKINTQCQETWTEMAEEKDASGNLKYPEAQRELEKFKDKPAAFGKEITCTKVFGNDHAKIRECNQYLSSHFQKGKTFAVGEEQARIEVCADAQCRTSARNLEDGDIATSGSAAKPMSEGERVTFEEKTREAYQKAMRADKAHWPAANFNPYKSCPSAPDDGVNAEPSTVAPRYSSVGQFPACARPYRNASQAVKDAYDAVKSGPEQAKKDESGEGFRQNLENRIIGVMMMGECCASKTCADALSSKHGITLDGAKTAQ